MDIQSIARCGSSIDSVSAIASSSAAATTRGDRLLGAGRSNLGQSGRPRRVEVVDVGPLVVDRLAEVGQRPLGGDGTVDEIADENDRRCHVRQPSPSLLPAVAGPVASAGQPTAAANPGNGSGGGVRPAATWALTIVSLERAPAAIVPGTTIGSGGGDPETGGLGPSTLPRQLVDRIERHAVEDRQVLGEHGVRSHRLNLARGRVGWA